MKLKMKLKMKRRKVEDDVERGQKRCGRGTEEGRMTERKEKSMERKNKSMEKKLKTESERKRMRM